MEQGRRRLHGRLGRPLAVAHPHHRTPGRLARPGVRASPGRRCPGTEERTAGVRIGARTIGGCPAPPTTTPSAGPARRRIPRSPARPSRSARCRAAAPTPTPRPPR
ncbi:hypothetical protein DOU17_13615, partial [Clavibacter michiganensis subsp. michiganensis]|nr:hypothetical protein [Clavibacter michiganensis subsp. michiganensis]